jgi:PAS domain S-box-containing protein
LFHIHPRDWPQFIHLAGRLGALACPPKALAPRYQSLGVIVAVLACGTMTACGRTGNSDRNACCAAPPSVTQTAEAVRSNRSPFVSLRVRLLLLVLLGAVPALSLTARTMFEWRRYEVREARQDALELARRVATRQEGRIELGREALLGLSRLTADRLRDPDECRRLLIARWSESARHDLLGVADSHGRPACAVRGTDGGAAQTARFSVPRPTTLVDTVDVTAGTTIVAGQTIATLAQAVQDGTGRTAATVFTKLAIGDLAAGEATTGTTFTLIDASGVILARAPDGAGWLGRSTVMLPVFRHIIGAQGESTAEGIDVDGVSRLFAFRPVRGLPPSDGHIVIGIARTTAFADGNRIIRRSLIELAVVAALALAAAWVGTDVFLLRQTKAMLATARRLTQGELGARTGVRGGSGELAELSRTFDEMASALETRQAEADRAREALARAHEVLEERVRSRTAALIQANDALEEALAQRRRAEDALKKLSSAVEQAADSVMIANRDGVIEYVNPAFETLTGWAAREVIGGTARILKSGVHGPEFYANLWRTITAGQVFRAVFVNRKKNGEPYDEEKIITPLRDARGEISHFVSAARDITERKRADEQLRSSREELRALAAHVESVREEERSRIAREIHDELGQALTALRFDLCRLGGVALGDPNVLGQRVTGMTMLIDRTIASVRRIATELRPGVLDDLGLAAAIEWQAHEFEARTGIGCAVVTPSADPELGRDVSTAVFRIFQETLTNVARHARARHAEVTLSTDGERVRLVMRDDGRGITDAEVGGRRSLGLLGMRERARLLGGHVTIVGRPGEGTTVSVELPVGRQKPDMQGDLGSTHAETLSPATVER